MKTYLCLLVLAVAAGLLLGCLEEDQREKKPYFNPPSERLAILESHNMHNSWGYGIGDVYVIRDNKTGREYIVTTGAGIVDAGAQ